MSNIIEKDGKKYLIIGDKAILFDTVDENGKPIIKVESEETSYPDGRKDVTIKVPYLKIMGKERSM